MRRNWSGNTRVMLLTPFLIVLLFIVACGGGAEAPAATTAAGDVAAPDAVPTATPVAGAGPSDPDLSRGKVIFMVGGFGAERFDQVVPGGSLSKEPRKAFHGHLTSWEQNDDGTMRFSPGIASKWELADGGKTVIYTIGEGYKFHDGTTIDMDDALWTLQHSVGPAGVDYGAGVTINYARNMNEVVVGPGPRQISIRSRVQIPELPFYSAENEGGAANGQVYPARDKWLNGCKCPDDVYSAAETDAYDANPVGAGFLDLVEHVPSTLMAFERFDDFYYQPANGFPTDKRIKFAAMDMQLVPEEAIRASALEAGNADIGRITLETLPQVEAGGGRLVLSPESVMIETFLYGCYKPELPCFNKGVRQAYSYAMDRQSMADNLFNKGAKPGQDIFEINGWWIVTKSTFGYKPDLDPYPFDPQKARDLFTAAGIKNPDNPGGKDHGEWVINTFPDPLAPFLVESARLFAKNLRDELGMEVTVRVFDKVGFSKARINREDFHGQIAWVAQNTRMEGGGISRGVYITPERPELEFTRTSVHDDPELFAVVRDALTTVGSPGFEEVFHDLWVRLRDESYSLHTGYINAPWGIGPRIATWVPYPVCEYACALHTITLAE